MPETNKRSVMTGGSQEFTNGAKRQKPAAGVKYPSGKPSGAAGKYEHTASGQKRRGSF